MASIRRRIDQLEDDELDDHGAVRADRCPEGRTGGRNRTLEAETERLTDDLAAAEAEIATELETVRARAGRRRGRRSRRSVGRVRQVALAARRRRRRPAGRHGLPGMPPAALGGRDRPHPQAGCRRARATARRVAASSCATDPDRVPGGAPPVGRWLAESLRYARTVQSVNYPCVSRLEVPASIRTCRRQLADSANGCQAPPDPQVLGWNPRGRTTASRPRHPAGALSGCGSRSTMDRAHQCAPG